MPTRPWERPNVRGAALLALCALNSGPALSRQSVPLPRPAPLTLRFLTADSGDAVVVTAPTGEVLLYLASPQRRRVDELKRLYTLDRIDAVVPGNSGSLTTTWFRAHGAAFPPPPGSGWLKGAEARRPLSAQGEVTDFNVGEVRLMILPSPDGGVSVNVPPALRIDYGGFSALLTGHTLVAQTAGWLRTFPGQPLGPVDVYGTVIRAGGTGDTADWLRSVRPRQVIARVSPDGGLPAAVLGAYQQAGAAVWRTDRQGTITVSVWQNGWYQVKAERGLTSGVLPPVGQVVPAVPPSLDRLPPTSIPDGY